MKLLQQCILLSSSAVAVVASSVDGSVNSNANVKNDLSSSESSLTSSSSTSLSSSSSSSSSSMDFHSVGQHEGGHQELKQFEQHEKHEPQTIHSYTNNGNENHDTYSRRYLREWEQSLNTVNFKDGKYEFYNPNTYRDDYVSSEVQISSNGARIAVRGSNPDGDNYYALYDIGTRDTNTQWIYETVSATTTTVLPGSSVSLSADSNELAIGTNDCDYNSADIPGTMCVYVGEADNNSPDAPEKGPMLELYLDDTSLVSSWGISVSLSNQGVYSVVGSSHGMVYVYNTPVMLLLTPGNGATLSLAKNGDPIVVDPNAIANGDTTTFGEIVKMAGDESAKTFAVGGKESERVGVYRYINTTKKWTKLGGDIVANGDEFAISDNGQIVATKYRDSEVRVYHLKNNKWEILGSNTIMVDSDKTPSLSISANGKILAVGAYKGPSRNSATNAGYVELYEYVSSKNRWVPMAVPLVDPNGRTSNVDFGRSVSLSGDGMRLAVAAPAYDSIFDKKNAAYVKVYDLSDPFPSVAPSKAPSAKPSKPPSRSPTRSPAPSNNPATAPSATPTSRPSTSEPSPSPSANPTKSFLPSMSPSVSHSPSIPPTGRPTSSTCTSNCDCAGSENPFCTLALCRYNCNCDEGGCDLSVCEYDCRCKGGGCNMNQCQSNCQCEGRNCQMDNCIYNGRCNQPSPDFLIISRGSSLLIGEGRSNGVMVTVCLMMAGLLAVGVF